MHEISCFLGIRGRCASAVPALQRSEWARRSGAGAPAAGDELPWRTREREQERERERQRVPGGLEAFRARERGVGEELEAEGPAGGGSVRDMDADLPWRVRSFEERALEKDVGGRGGVAGIEGARGTGPVFGSMLEISPAGWDGEGSGPGFDGARKREWTGQEWDQVSGHVSVQDLLLFLPAGNAPARAHACTLTRTRTPHM